jgi:hypothetical protein
MSEIRPHDDAPPPDDVAHCNNIRDRIFVGLVLITLVRTSEALAGDQTSINNANLNRDVGNFRQLSPSAPAAIATPGFFTAPTDAGHQIFSATDFRPRKRTVFDTDPAVNAFRDAPMLEGTTVWQRMSEYKSHDGVRLLTLWESRGSTLSIQAGNRGDPSLQWTSRTMNRGGSTRGLFDRLFSISISGAGSGLRNASRPPNAPATPKPVGAPAVAGLK